MLIILCLYIVALWVLFGKFELVRWGWLSGAVSVLFGAFILAVFLALFNYLTPSGKVTVASRVVEVTPNVTGQIVAIPVRPNVPVKTGDVLFQIDQAPFQFKVSQLQASLAAARQQTEILKSNYQQATASVAGLPRSSNSTPSALPIFKRLRRRAQTPSSGSRISRLRTVRINTRRRWRSSTWPKRLS